MRLLRLIPLALLVLLSKAGARAPGVYVLLLLLPALDLGKPRSLCDSGILRTVQPLVIEQSTVSDLHLVRLIKQVISLTA